MRNKELYVAESGPDGSPSVLLLHAAGTSGWMWHRLAEDLSHAFHVLVPDLPGHGRSNARGWRSLRDTAVLLDRVLGDRAHDGTAHVVGLSLGGYVGLEMTGSSRRIGSLMVSGVNVLPFPHPRWMRAVGRVIEPVMHSEAFIRFNARSLRIPKEQFTRFRAAARSADRASLRAVNAEALHYRVPDHAPDARVPLLAVAGAKEHDLILRSLPEIRDAFPGAIAGVAPAAHHGWNGEHPELFSRVVQEWIRKPALPAGLLPAGEPRSARRPGGR